VPDPVATVANAEGGGFLFTIGTEVGPSTIVSGVPDIVRDEGVVSAVLISTVLGVEMVVVLAVVASAVSSSSLSNADIERPLGMPTERPARSRVLRSVPNEPLRRL